MMSEGDKENKSVYIDLKRDVTYKRKNRDNEDIVFFSKDDLNF